MTDTLRGQHPDPPADGDPVSVEAVGDMVIISVPGQMRMELTWRHAVDLGTALLHVAEHACAAAGLTRVGHDAHLEQSQARSASCRTFTGGQP